MHRRPLASLASLAFLASLAALAALAACPEPRAPAPIASCPEAARLLDEAAAARAGGYLFRALARAEAAHRACASEATRRALAELRVELWGPGDSRAPAAAPAPADAAAVRAAALLRLAGEPDQALAKLLPIAARLDPAGRAELSRVLAASQRSPEARAALEQAAARAERRHGGHGRWRWLPADHRRLDHLAFTHDGARLIAGDSDAWIRVWDVAGGHELARMRALRAPDRIAVSPDGAWIAATHLGSPVEVWDAATGKRALELPRSGPPGKVAAFTPESHLVVRSTAGMVELELPSGKQIDRLELGDPSGLVITRDRIYAAGEGASQQPIVTVWERRGGHRKLDQIAIEPAAARPLRDLGVTPRGELVVQLHDQIVIHNAQGKLRRTIAGERAAMALAADGKRLAASTLEGAVDLLDVGSGQPIRRLEAGPDLEAVAIHPRGALVATAGADGISIWSAAHGERTARLGPPSAARAIAFDADGRRLAVGSASGTVTLWDLATGGQTHVTPRAGAAVIRVAFGPGGDLATASDPPLEHRLQQSWTSPPGRLAVWDPRGALRWSKDLEQLSWLDFRPGAGTLATVSVIQTPGRSWRGVTLWDAQGAAKPALELLSGTARAWAPDGARLAYTELSRKLVVAPLDGGRAVERDMLAEHAAFQPGGALLALTSYDGRLSLWDAATVELRRVMREPSGDPAAIAWAPGGGVLASAAGQTVRLWDPRTGARLATLEAHDVVTAIAFRPDGRLLAAAGDDGVIELWSVADAAPVAWLATPGNGRGLVLAPDGAADGALADDDPLFWEVGGTTLHARAVWERQARPGLLAARLARVAADAAPRPGLPGAAPVPAPSTCVRAPDSDPVDFLSASAPDARSLSLCVLPAWRPPRPRPLPTCLVFDLASGAVHPRAPTPHEVLGWFQPPLASAALEDARLEVCHAGTCRALTIPELAADDDYLPDATAVVATDDGRLAAAILRRPYSNDHAAATGHAIVHDVATGRRIGKVALGGLGGEYSQLMLVGGTLLVTNTNTSPYCITPCLPSWLIDPRTGKRLGVVGGAQPLLVPDITAARVAGDVWAFHGSGAPAIIYQDVKTGRVVGRFDRPWPCRSDQEPYECRLHLLHAGGGLALLDDSSDAGRFLVLDARGAVIARHQVPRCKP